MEIGTTFIPKVFVKLRCYKIENYCLNVANTSLEQRLIAFHCHIFSAYICVISWFASFALKVEQLKLRLL